MKTWKLILQNKFFSDTIAYTGSIVLARGLSIIIFPILVASMNENDLVNYDWALTNVMLGVTFCVFGVDSAVGRMLKYEVKDQSQLQTASFFIIVVQTIITALLFFLYLRLSNIQLAGTDACLLIILLLSLIIINQVTNTAKWLLQRNKVIKIQVSLGISQAFFLYLVYVTGLLSFSTALAAQMVGAILVAVYSVHQNKGGFSNINILLNIKKIFRKSSILGVNTIIGGIYQALEKNIIYQSVSTADATTYLIHFKVVLLYGFGLSALQISVAPHMVDILNKRKHNKFILYNSIIILGVLIAAFVFLGISPFILDYFSQKHEINPTLLIILLSIQGLIIISSLCEIIFIYLEKYKTILFFNTFHIIVFCLPALIWANKKVETITMFALVAFVAKIILMLIFNYNNFVRFKQLK